jgi:hypothetical protein
VLNARRPPADHALKEPPPRPECGQEESRAVIDAYRGHIRVGLHDRARLYTAVMHGSFVAIAIFAVWTGSEDSIGALLAIGLLTP